MSIEPGLLGAAVHAGGARPDRRARGGSSRCRSRSTAASARTTRARVRARGREPVRRRERGLRRPRPRGRVPAHPRAAAAMSLERALELAGRSPRESRIRTRPSARSSSPAGAIVGEGVTEAYGGRHGEVVALEAAGERARGATIYVTMEPCAHHGRDAAVRRRDRRGGDRARRRRLPRPEPRGRRRARASARRRASRSSSTTGSRRGGRTRPGGRGTSLGRPFVTYKVAITLDGRVTVPGRALGDRGGVAAARPRAARRLRRGRRRDGDRARRRPAARRARRRRAAAAAAARLRPRPAAGRLRARAPHRPARRGARRRSPREGVQSLLLEGGPTLATAFVEAGLVDKLLLFVAPTLAGAGPRSSGELPAPLLAAAPVAARPVGDDLLVEAYLREP